MANYNESMQGLFRRYEQQVGVTGLTSLKDVGHWAIDQGLWQPRHADMLRQFSSEMARALREEFYTDPQGRRVRTKHAIRLPPTKEGGDQKSLWGDIRWMTKEQMETSAKQRRHGIVWDCHHLKTDVDSYNDNRSPIDPIQISFDFTADLDELGAERDLAAAS